MRIAQLVIITIALALTLALAVAPRARAQANGEVRVVAGVTTSSLADLELVAREFDATLPPILTPGGIETVFGFIGPGGLRPEAPVGLYLVAGTQLLPQQSLIFAFPVQLNVAQIQDIVRVGGVRVQGTSDTAVIAGFPVKRTLKYLFVGGTPGAMAQINENTILSAHRNGAAFVRVQGDLASLRRAMPRQFEKFINDLEAGARVQNNTALMLAQLFTSPVRSDIQTLDFQFDRTRSDWRLSLTIDGYEPWKLVRYPRPRFPGRVIASADFVYPDDETARWPMRVLDKLAAAAIQDQLLPAPIQAQIELVLADVTELLLVGNAMSWALAEVEGKLVVYAVMQHDKPVEVKQRVAEMVRSADSVIGGAPPQFRFLADIGYTASSGAEITRLHLLKVGEPIGYLDLAAQHNMVVLAASLDSDRYIEALLPMKTYGRMQSGISGFIDVPTLITSLRKLPDGPFADADEKQIGRLAGQLENRKVSFSAAFEKAGLIIKLDVPPKLPAVVRELQKLAAP